MSKYFLFFCALFAFFSEPLRAFAGEPEVLEEKCPSNGTSQDCLKLALERLFAGKVLPAKSLLTETCAKPDANSCWELGRLERDRGEPELMVAAFKKSCALGHKESCSALAAQEKSSARLAQLEKHKRHHCKPADPSHCLGLARHHHNRADLPRAIQSFVPACHGGKSEACLALGEIARAAESPVEAKLRFGKACAKKIAMACRAAAALSPAIAP